MNEIVYGVAKVVFYPLWKIFEKQSKVQLNIIIDELQRKYLDNTNTIEEKLLNSSVYGDHNITDNATIKEVVREAQKNFETSLNLDTKGVGSASIKYSF